jgi:hypothetical protein
VLDVAPTALILLLVADRGLLQLVLRAGDEGVGLAEVVLQQAEQVVEGAEVVRGGPLR